MASASARWTALALLAFVLGGGPTITWAHGDLDGQIARVSKQLAEAPSAELYLKRGELHHDHEDFEEAMADYDRAAAMDPELDAVALARGRTLFNAGRLPSARAALDSYVKRKPTHAEGFLLRARILAALHDYAGAVTDFDRNLALTQQPLPECFLERTEAMAALGDKPAAVKSLDEGLSRLGNLVTLQAAAIDLELTLGRYDAALGRVDRILADLQRKETWLTRRGEILEDAGRRDEALGAYREALASLERLHPRQRNVRPMRALEARLRQILAAHLPPVSSHTHQTSTN